MNRALRSAAISLLALWPLSAAAASPTPSPSLNQLLATPPAGFTEVTSAAIHGEFTAHDYAAIADASKQATVEQTLNSSGFIDGYGKTWVHNAAQHVLVEEVFAFTGGHGARDWLNAAEVGDKANSTYKHADSMSGIDPYYGEHIVDSTGKLFGDAFAFAKGNDVFVVGVVSAKDDALPEAMSQTRTQYDQAPSQTIPSSQWPENAAGAPHSLAYYVGFFIPVVLIAAIALGVGMFLVGRSRRRAAAAIPAGGMPVTAAPAVQLSPDGNYWWDGQAWRDAVHEVPPAAQRSADGTFWWDGRTWRPVPQAPPPGA